MPILFENLNAKAIRKAALKTNGATGLCSLDVLSWGILCNSFKSSNDLCTALACVGKHLCTTCVNSDHLSAFLLHAILLDKCPGVRQIGIGEVHRRIVTKAILTLLKQDILDAAGPLQVCAMFFEIEHSIFTPLTLSTSGGMGREVQTTTNAWPTCCV